MQKNNIEEIIDYIEDNLSNDISLTDIATRVNYSPFYCSTSFRKYIGISIKKYILKRRLQCAADDLCLTKLRIIDIAYKYCYSSQEAFSRAFLSCYGISPYEYRKNKLPVSQFNSKSTYNNESDNQGDVMKNEIINTIQEEIYSKYESNVLHILNGSCMMDEFKKKKWCNENFTYVSFNEAMCWGEADEEIFSQAFIEKRVQSLNGTIEQYRDIVLNPLEPLFKNEFDTIVLWFGDDMFCQMNMLTILAYLEQSNFDGDVLFCMAIESSDEMLPNAYEIDINGSYQRYKRIICNKQMPNEKLMPVLYQATLLYLNYLNKDSEINRYIIEHINKSEKQLINELFSNFPQYGLGDLQYKMLIKNINKTYQ